MKPRFWSQLSRFVVIAAVLMCAVAAGPCTGSPETKETLFKAGTRLFEHGSDAFLGSVPKLRSSDEIQVATLRADIKSSACNWLAEYVRTGVEPSSDAFFRPLTEKLSHFGNPVQNETASLQGTFAQFSSAISGTADAEAVARRFACSFIPG